MSVLIRETQASDFSGIISLCGEVYPGSPVWMDSQLRSHLDLFPEGQFVAVDKDSDRIVGMSASLIISWDDYDFKNSWREFTDSGFFTNHDPQNGRTLYAAEIMVSPSSQGEGIGTLLYEAREALVRRRKLLRIRAGARLRGYSRYAEKMGPDEYTIAVIKNEIMDPTLSFQLNRGFRVLHVVSGYLNYDPESKGYAAVIEWLNEDVAKPDDFLKGNPKFRLS